MVATRTHGPDAPAPSAHGRAGLAVVAVGVVLIVGTAVVGRHIGAAAPLHLGSPPLYGRWAPRWSARLSVAVLAGALLVTGGPAAARRLRWGALLLASWCATAIWAVALAVADGWDRLPRPLESRFEYLAVVDEARSLGVGRFLSTYVHALPTYPTHVRGHPPGMAVLFAGLDAIGLGGAGWAAAVVITLGATSTASVLVATRALAGEATARAAAPFVVASPWVLFLATTADAVFAAAAAAALASLAIAGAADRRRRSEVLGVSAGVLGAVALHLTYGVVPLLGLAGGAVLLRSARRPWRGAVAGAAACTGAVALAGFWWFDGLAATRAEYVDGFGGDRPASYFLVANVACLALMLGPAALAGLPGALRRPGLGALLGGVLLAVAVADLSGLSKGEVERIWLPFLPWCALAAVALPDRKGWMRISLGAQAGLTVALQALVRWPW